MGEEKESLNKQNYIKISMKGGILVVSIIILVVIISSVSGGIYLNSKINGLYNNGELIKNSQKITDSTVLVLVRTDSYEINDMTSGSIYVDDAGETWKKGTAFSIGDGLFITASHVLDGSDGKQNKIIWNGKEYDNIIAGGGSLNGVDFMMFRANLDIPSVKIIDNGEQLAGAKIAFIGFPLNEMNPVLHDGIISSSIPVGNNLYSYSINSFVNKGNSGGPVFLADTGEVIGVISSRQSESIIAPPIDETKLTDGEKEIINAMGYMIVQLAQNTQAGIGNVIGIDNRFITDIKSHNPNI